MTRVVGCLVVYMGSALVAAKALQHVTGYPYLTPCAIVVGGTVVATVALLRVAIGEDRP